MEINTISLLESIFAGRVSCSAYLIALFFSMVLLPFRHEFRQSALNHLSKCFQVAAGKSLRLDLLHGYEAKAGSLARPLHMAVRRVMVVRVC
jgi:hypothetical protein